MRVIKNGNNSQAITFAKYLLVVGENNNDFERIINTDIMRIPDYLLIDHNLPNIPETLINIIFPTIFSGIIENGSAILTPTNCDCDVINSIAIRKFSEETPIVNLYSADTVKNNDGTDNQNNVYIQQNFWIH